MENKKRSLYCKFLDEREEILKHKWIESEKQGYNTGFDKALVDWTINHRTNWSKTQEDCECVSIKISSNSTTFSDTDIKP